MKSYFTAGSILANPYQSIIRILNVKIPWILTHDYINLRDLALVKNPWVETRELGNLGGLATCGFINLGEPDPAPHAQSHIISF